MKYDLKQYQKTYGKKPIEECVNLVKKLNSEMIERGENLVGLLWYLEKSKRFKEFKGYEKLGYEEFVWEVCKIPYNRYRELAYAYNWYPVESREYGPQTIQKIKTAVGVTKIPKVLSEIKTKTADIKDPIKLRESVSDIIKKYTLPKKVKTKVLHCENCDKLKADLAAAYKRIKELEAQLERQKPSVKAFMDMQDIFKDKISNYRNELRQ